MRHKFPSFLIVILFFLILLFVPVYWVVNADSPPEMSWLEGRQLAGFDSLQNRGFIACFKAFARGDVQQGKQIIREQLIERSFQNDLETVLSDQFPARQVLIKTAKAVDRGIISLAYAALPDPAVPADRNSGYTVTRGRSAIMIRPEPFRPATFEAIDARINNYDALIEKHPEIHFYVYYIERIQNVSAHPLDGMYPSLERGRHFDYFLKQKPEGLSVAKFSINTFEDHLEYFYRTDHHWNIFGVLRAYNGVYQMIAPNFPTISPERIYTDFITFENIRFRGSSARKAFYPMWEPFTVVDTNLPPHTVWDNGVEIVYGGSQQYFAGKYPQDPYYNHYEGFFGGDRPLLEFVFEGNPDRSLLVIGNSYNNALMPLLASHYRRTYDVDLRYYPDFSLSAFLAEHPVDDILVIGENSVAFNSENYLIHP